MRDEPLDPADDSRLDAAVRTAYRAPHPLEARSEARVLERVARPRAPGFRWWFEPQWSLRPVAALGLLAVTLMAGVWAGARWTGRPQVPAAGRTAGPPGSGVAHGVPVTFVLRAPGATSVCVAGDFNSWDAAATPMSHAGSGDLWIVSVELPRGVHLYSFVLDGAEWRPDPSAPLAADDAFGGHNSVIVVNGAKNL